MIRLSVFVCALVLCGCSVDEAPSQSYTDQAVQAVLSRRVDILGAVPEWPGGIGGNGANRIANVWTFSSQNWVYLPVSVNDGETITGYQVYVNKGSSSTFTIMSSLIAFDSATGEQAVIGTSNTAAWAPGRVTLGTASMAHQVMPGFSYMIRVSDGSGSIASGADSFTDARLLYTCESCTAPFPVAPPTTTVVPVVPPEVTGPLQQRSAVISGAGSATRALVIPLATTVGRTITSLRMRVTDSTVGPTMVHFQLVDTSDASEGFSVIATSANSTGSGTEQTLTLPLFQPALADHQYYAVASTSSGSASSNVWRLEIDQQ